ncbi:hypothetical protein LSM04_005945 [Trypanosoma melophagium]|uniref:uncharacterized protein n=1 Tax=Trypanosoma melophagium TaxID=715481 RepID=UPI00351A8F31|nr:hypothetical protein LSM04_005945 [Trypanosoma melophagium]
MPSDAAVAVKWAYGLAARFGSYTYTFAQALAMFVAELLCLVVFIAALSYLWLNRSFSRRECTGIGVVVIGLTLVGISTVMRVSPTRNTNTRVGRANSNPLPGAVLMFQRSFCTPIRVSVRNG